MITLRWMIRDTFRQSIATGIFGILLGVSCLAVVVCASAKVRGSAMLEHGEHGADFLPRRDVDVAKLSSGPGPDVITGDLDLAFGTIRIPLARDGRDAVRTIQFFLAAAVADTLGLLLTLIWTAGFLPGFLDERAVTVLLAKPVSRGGLLFGKYASVLVFVSAHAVLFVLGTFAALGLATGIWEPAYLWTIPLLLFHFAIFFSFSLLLAVMSRSAVVCVFGSILFWALCWGMNYGRHVMLAENLVNHQTAFGPAISLMTEIGYWTLPKPYDLGMILYEAMDAGRHFSRADSFTVVRQAGEFHAVASVCLSAAFTIFVLFAAVREFEEKDY